MGQQYIISFDDPNRRRKFQRIINNWFFVKGVDLLFEKEFVRNPSYRNSSQSRVIARIIDDDRSYKDVYRFPEKEAVGRFYIDRTSKPGYWFELPEDAILYKMKFYHPEHYLD